MKLIQKSISLIFIIILIAQNFGLGMSKHECKSENLSLVSLYLFENFEENDCSSCKKLEAQSCCSIKQNVNQSTLKSNCCSDSNEDLKINKPYKISERHNIKELNSENLGFKKDNTTLLISINRSFNIDNILEQCHPNDLNVQLCTFLL